MNTTPAPDRAEIETSLTTIRHRISKAREQLQRLDSNRGHLYRKESLLRGLLSRADRGELPTNEDPVEIQRQLYETLTELDRFDQEIDGLESEIDNLQVASMEHIEALEINRRLPGIVRDLTVLWGCRASRGRVAPSLPAYASDLLRDSLKNTGLAFQSGEKNLDCITNQLKRQHNI